MNQEAKFSNEQVAEAVDLVVNQGLTLTTAANLCGVPCKVVRDGMHKLPKIEVRRSRRCQSPEAKRILTANLTEERCKKAVKQAKKYLHEKGHIVKLGEVYHVAAILLGYRNWNTLSACGFEDVQPNTELQIKSHEDNK